MILRTLTAGLAGLMLGLGSAGAQPAGPVPTGFDQPRDELPPQPRMLTMRDNRPELTLFGGNLTITPVARLDTDFGGFWDQDRAPNGQPTKFLSNIPDRTGNSPPPPLGIDVRRGRLGLQGTYLRDFTYNFTWEFAPSVGSQWDPVKNSRLFELQTAYTGIKWVTPRFGFYTLAHTIEFAMSSFELTFIERPSIITVATSLASGDSRLAIGGEARGDRWFASFYLADGSSTTLNDSRQRGIVGRATGLAVNGDWAKVNIGFNGVTQLHPGTNAGPQQVRLRDYPELRLDPARLLATPNISAGSAYAIGPEFAAVIGPVYLQSEYQTIRVNQDNGPTVNFWGYYVTAAVPLIGPPRRFDTVRGVFTRPGFAELNPNEGTWGWLEAAARYSYINLNDQNIRGNSQSVTQVALNYYPTRQLRLTLEYLNGNVNLAGPNRYFQALAGRLSFNW